jgi:hypothetical protein
MDEWEESKRRTREEAQQNLRQQRRGPTQAERACIDLLERLLHDLDSSLAAVVLRDVSYLIAGTDAILGAWQRSRAYKSREIYLAAKLFDGPFRTAFATLLHEASHLFGDDGSRGFTDSLTNLFERIFGHVKRLRSYRKQWAQLRKQVRAERASIAAAASPAVIPPPTTVDAVFQTLISVPPATANLAVLRFVCERDDGTLVRTAREGLTEEELEELGLPTSCGPRPTQSRWLPAETLVRERLGKEPSPAEAAYRSGMRRARHHRGNVVRHRASRNDGQAEPVLKPQAPQAGEKGGSSRHGVLAIGALVSPQPESESPTVAAKQPLTTADATLSIAATAAEGVTGA